MVTDRVHVCDFSPSPNPPGLVIGGPLAALVLYFVNGDPIAWRGVFILEGVLFLLAAPFIFIFMPLAPDKCDSFLTPLESAYMKQQAEEVQAEKRRRSVKIASAVGEQQVMAELLRDARILLLALTACLRRVAVYGQVRSASCALTVSNSVYVCVSRRIREPT